MVNHSALKCLLAADSDSVVSGSDDHSGGNGVGLPQRSLGAGAGNGSVCKNKNEAKMQKQKKGEKAHFCVPHCHVRTRFFIICCADIALG